MGKGNCGKSSNSSQGRGKGGQGNGSEGKGIKGGEVSEGGKGGKAIGPGQGRMRDEGTTKDRAVNNNQERGKGCRGDCHSPCGCNCKGQAGVVLSSWGGRGGQSLSLA